MVETFEKILETLPTFMKRDSNSSNYKFVKSFNEDFNDLATAILGLAQAVNINDMEGSDLDTFAKLFNLNRQTAETDEEFRSRIKSFVPSNRSGGTDDNLKDAISQILQLDKSLIVITTTGANTFNVSLTINEEFDDTLLNNLNDTVQKAKAAGNFFQGYTLISEDNIALVNFESVNSGLFVL